MKQQFQRVAPYIYQLLITEALSTCLLGWQLGFIAPIAVFFMPLWTFEARNFLGFVAFLTFDLVLVGTLCYLIAKNRRILGAIYLGIVNFICFVLTIGALP